MLVDFTRERTVLLDVEQLGLHCSRTLVLLHRCKLAAFDGLVDDLSEALRRRRGLICFRAASVFLLGLLGVEANNVLQIVLIGHTVSPKSLWSAIPLGLLLLVLYGSLSQKCSVGSMPPILN